MSLNQMNQQELLVKKVMTPFPYTIEATATITAAKEMMHEHSIRHLPVMHENELAGIVSDRDIHLTESILARIGDAVDILVSEAYTPEPYSVDIETPVSTVASELADRSIGSAIVTKKGKVVGIFTSTDACRCLGEMLAPEGPEPEEKRQSTV